jgi:hypothetical protein
MIEKRKAVTKEPKEPLKTYTYDELLNDDFQTFGYFCNKMNKPYEEVAGYFRSRCLVDLNIQVMGVYVRKRVDKNSADDVKVRY